MIRQSASSAGSATPLRLGARAEAVTVMSEAKRQKSDDPPYDGGDGDGDGDGDDGDDGDDDDEDKGENGEEDPPPAPSDAPGADLSKVPNFRPTVTLFPPRALPPTLS